MWVTDHVVLSGFGAAPCAFFWICLEFLLQRNRYGELINLWTQKIFP